ncbi:MAG: dihydrolipoamide acetyltransferase family protein [Alkalispirochaeta sp.]
MAEKIPMTALSPTMEEGTISSWTAKEGDTISAGDVLCEVETDKASMEYEATQEGTLLKIIVGEGGNAVVGQTIAILGEKGEDISALVEEASSEGGSAGGAAKEPASDERSDAEGEKEDADGKSSAAATAEGEDTDAKEKEAKKDTATAGSSSKTSAPERVASDARSDGSRIKASPLAVKLAAERNINLALVSGSGPGGRIVKEDIESFRGVSAATVTGPVAGGTAAASPADREIPVAGKRAVIAKRLSESKFTAPHYYLKTSVEMAGVMDARKMLNASLPSKVSLNAFFLKFAAEAIKRHPGINASWQGDKIVEYGSIDIGIAVDLGNGLITPVVRNCGNKGVKEIDAELQELVTKAGEGKLKTEEYTGATFTISNLGSFGVEEFTAIINPPGSAILALGATKKTPVVRDDGSIGIASVMKMTLSCDHRVIDGAAGGRFLSELQQIMEHPVRVIF